MLTEEQETEAGLFLAYALLLKKDKEHPDRFKTGYGTKTALGIYRTLKDMIEHAEAGDIQHLRP